MHVRKAGRPVSVDVGHILPRRERLGERVEQTFFRFVNLGDAEDIVNVGHNCQSSWGHQVCGDISNRRPINVRVESLDRRCLIARLTSVAGNWDKGIEIALGRSIVG